jgi:hypothetical protein
MSEAPGTGAEAELSEQDIVTRLQQLRDVPYGAARSARTEELADACELLGLDELHTAALFELMQAYEYGSEQHKAPVLFARILQLYEEKPDTFNEWRVHRLYWFFKWINSTLIIMPEVPLATLHGWMARMRDQYEKAGNPLHAVYACRFDLAMHTGVGMDEAFDAWVTRPRDEFSNCEACEARARGVFWARRGEDVRALREWRPVLDGELGCHEEPAATVSFALLPLVRTGRTDEAASLHRSGYRSTRGQVSMDGEVGRHLEFAALTGNGARGLELLAENRNRFGSTAAPLVRLEFLTGVRVLLGRLAADGHETLPAPGPAGSEHTVGSLLASVAREADEIAARFDERNGTGTVGDLLRERCAQGLLTAQPLPLGVRIAVLATPATDAPGTGETARTEPTAATPRRSGSAEPLPEDFGALLTRARELSLLGHPDTDGFWEAVAARVTEADLDGVLRGELANGRARVARKKHDWLGAREASLEAAELFDAAGEPSRAASSRANAAWDGLSHDPAAVEQTWIELDEQLARADELLTGGLILPNRYLYVTQCRTAAAASMTRTAIRTRTAGQGTGTATDPVTDPATDPGGSQADPDESGAEAAAHQVPVNETVAEDSEAALAAAFALFDREAAAYRAAAERLGVEHQVGIACTMAADRLALRGRIEDAIAAARTGAAAIERSDRPWLAPRTLALLAQLLTHSGVLEEAAGLLHRALAVLAEWPDPEFPSGQVYAVLAENRERAGDLPAAAGHYTTAAAQFDRLGEAVPAAAMRSFLGRVLMRQNRTADAVAVLESLLEEEAERQLQPEDRAQIRLDLGDALAEQGEHRAAAEAFAWLAEYVDAWPNRRLRTMATARAARALYLAGAWDAAGAAADRALGFHGEGAEPVEITAMLRTGAEASSRSRGAQAVPEALELLRRADEVNEATEERVEPGYRYRRFPERAMNAELRARALAAAERDEEALVAAVAAVAAWTEGGAEALRPTADATRLAAVIEGRRLGRVDAARERLAPVIERCRAAGFEEYARQLEELRESLAVPGAPGAQEAQA